MTAYVSRCPNCDTSFKVTDAQLDAADGAVRCGACLQVFIASDYFVEAPIPDLFAENSQTVSAAVREDEDPTNAGELATPEAADAAEFAGMAVASSELQGEIDQEPEAFTYNPAPNDHQSVQPEHVQPQYTQPEPVDESVEEPVNEPINEPIEEPIEELIDEHLAQAAIADLSATEITENLDGIANAAPEELVGDLVPVANNRRIVSWVAGCALALVVLGAQYLWFERDRLAMDAQLRAYYLSVCNVVNCQLPDYLDAANLIATDLVVRTHPTAGNGLIVDAILRNGSPYRQRFPSLQLRFADINGNTLAQRTFSPDAYLAGELAGLRYIPAVTEVRLSLDIVDPGPLAVSYSMRTVIN